MLDAEARGHVGRERTLELHRPRVAVRVVRERAGRVALHVTYHCPFDERAREEPTVAAILGSLRNLDAD